MKLRHLIPGIALGVMLSIGGTIYAFQEQARTLASSIVAAVGPMHASNYMGTVIDSVALDAASSSFEFEGPEQSTWGLAAVFVTITDANDSVTDITMTCTCSCDNNTTDYTLQDCNTASGVCTSSDASWSKDPSSITSPKRWMWRVDIEGAPDFECTFTDTGGVAADSIDVDLTVSTKG